LAATRVSPERCLCRNLGGPSHTKLEHPQVQRGAPGGAIYRGSSVPPGDDAGPQSIAHHLAGRPRPKTRPPPVSHTAAPPRGRSRPGPRRSIVHLHLVAAAQQPLCDGDAHPAESDDADFHVLPTPLIAPGAGPGARTELRAPARRRSAGARWTGSKRPPPRGGRDCARTCRSASG